MTRYEVGQNDVGREIEVSLAVEKEKKDTFAYRALDQIRNYALHRSFPLKGTGVAASWEGEPQTIRIGTQSARFST